MAKDHGLSIKDDEQYEALREGGYLQSSGDARSRTATAGGGNRRSEDQNNGGRPPKC